jgi:hypothetical protein
MRTDNDSLSALGADLRGSAYALEKSGFLQRAILPSFFLGAGVGTLVFKAPRLSVKAARFLWRVCNRRPR